MSSHGLSKVAAAIGGFLIFAGIIMIGVFALVFFSVINVDELERVYHMLFLGVLLVIGMLDLMSGIILRRE